MLCFQITEHFKPKKTLLLSWAWAAGRQKRWRQQQFSWRAVSIKNRAGYCFPINKPTKKDELSSHFSLAHTFFCFNHCFDQQKSRVWAYWQINLMGMMQIQNREFVMEIVELQSYLYTGVLLPLRQKGKTSWLDRSLDCCSWLDSWGEGGGKSKLFCSTEGYLSSPYTSVHEQLLPISQLATRPYLMQGSCLLNWGIFSYRP